MCYKGFEMVEIRMRRLLAAACIGPAFFLILITGLVADCGLWLLTWSHRKGFTDTVLAPAHPAHGQPPLPRMFLPSVAQSRDDWAISATSRFAMSILSLWVSPIPIGLVLEFWRACLIEAR